MGGMDLNGLRDTGVKVFVIVSGVSGVCVYQWLTCGAGDGY